MKPMHLLAGTALIVASAAFAQGKPDLPVDVEAKKAEALAFFEEALAKMPADVAEKVAAAREKAAAAKDDIASMDSKGKTKEEIEAMIAEKKAAAMGNLQKALDALDAVPEQAKESVAKAREKIESRLQERQSK